MPDLRYRVLSLPLVSRKSDLCVCEPLWKDWGPGPAVEWRLPLIPISPPVPSWGVNSTSWLQNPSPHQSTCHKYKPLVLYRYEIVLCFYLSFHVMYETKYIVRNTFTPRWMVYSICVVLKRENFFLYENKFLFRTKRKRNYFVVTPRNTSSRYDHLSIRVKTVWSLRVQ